MMGWEANASTPLAHYQETHQRMKLENLGFFHVLHLSPVDLLLRTLITENKYSFAQRAFADELKTSAPDPVNARVNSFQPSRILQRQFI